ncbi:MULTISPECIES: tetratricopeptide repeat protein [unclassified Pseudoalteromonas]|uniref:tetratricopeptide repeat protein n=1 Tax=unclassified Pseudoalteromonas TaxID=194690 RepID=UPI000C0879C9|nr:MULTISPECIES: tetratricopeptide repeat protein [unclassified Pseudoalteromonas]MDP2636438.1 tetratricopeptide repeat protein [Pseudoalteromonas sp. 1_MG-2023]PHN90859.1 hypothetical protein CSC79_04275 [Pseudoalteromonas sp. 3D05]
MTTSNANTCLAIVLFLILLSGCNATSNNTQLSAPPNFALMYSFKTLPVETPSEIFVLSEDIKQQLDSAFPPTKRNLQSTRKLLRFLLENGDESLSYQSGATLVASQAYRDLNANCLSLSILAYSMAEHLGMATQFQQVHIPEYWALNKGYNLLTSHINLRISQPLNKGSNIKHVYNSLDSVVIDFDPNSRGEKFQTSNISKARITAMFYNNKGVIAMLNKQYDLAYSYFGAATKTDNDYSSAWGNLAVLFRITNQFKDAELAYNYALEADKNNHTALGNLALLYKLTDRDEQASEILDSLDRKRQSNPYYHVSLGNTAYKDGAYRDAIKHYHKAKKLDKKLHDSYFGLAKTYYQLGDFKHAYKQLRLANKYADFKHDKERYQSKLAVLRNMTAKVSD